MKKRTTRRTCRDAGRYRQLVELRRWYYEIKGLSYGSSRKTRLLFNHPELVQGELDSGWTSYGHIELADGFEASESTMAGDLTLLLAYRMYQHLSKTLRGQT